MVGPGTGLAPFRSFLLQRWLAAAAPPSAPGMENGGGGKKGDGAAEPPVLFFGCRRRDQDYLYGEQLEAWSKEKKLRLFTAFSREKGAKKVYVQDRLKEQGELVWRLLQQGAHFYVCGDAARMAGDVERELLAILAGRGKLGQEGAAARLQEMSDSGRYQRDVWF